MSAAPETRYARSGDVHIAYQVFGAGPTDIVFVPGFVSNIEAIWRSPVHARFFERIGSFGRVILHHRACALQRLYQLKGIPGDWRLHAFVQ